MPISDLLNELEIRSLADCTHSLVLTRGESDALLPLCADHQSQQEVVEWLKKRKKKARSDTKDKCGLCLDIAAMASSTKRARNADLDEDFCQVHDADPSSSARARYQKPDKTPVSYEVRQPKDNTRRFGWFGHLMQTFNKFGPSVFSWDTWKSCIWDLFTHAGFLTYVHRDAGGYATY